MATNGLSTDAQGHSDVGGIAETFGDLRQLSLAEFSGHEFADVLVFVGVLVEIFPAATASSTVMAGLDALDREMGCIGLFSTKLGIVRVFRCRRPTLYKCHFFSLTLSARRGGECKIPNYPQLKLSAELVSTADNQTYFRLVTV